MTVDQLQETVSNAGLLVTEAMSARVLTPPIRPAEFLRQYLEGKKHRPKNIDGYVRTGEYFERYWKTCSS